MSTPLQDDIVHEDLTVLENLMVSATVEAGRESLGEEGERREGKRRGGEAGEERVRVWRGRGGEDAATKP